MGQTRNREQGLPLHADLAKQPTAVSFRALEASDRPAVEQICAHSVPSGDYILSVFDRWIAERDTYFFGAVDHLGTLVGLAHCRLTDDGNTAWCEGVRVAPELRGQGVGRALLAQSEEWARSHAAQRLRASVASTNAPSLALFSSSGFDQLACFDRWFAPPAGGGRLPRPLPLHELDLGHAFIQRFSPLQQTQGTYACGWSIHDFTGDRLARHLERQEVLLAGDSMGALAIVQHFDRGAEGTPTIVLLCGAPVAVTRLLRGIRTLAQLRGLSEVQATVAAASGLDGMLEHSGFTQQTSGFILLQERTLG